MTDKTTTSDVLKRPYRTILSPDPSGGFVATIHEFPGCVGYGGDANEALADLHARAESWVDAAIETGFPIPEPEDYDDYSGKIALRMSRRVHKMAAERAAREKVSLNQLLVTAIASYLGQVDGIGASKTDFQQTVADFLSSLSARAFCGVHFTTVNMLQVKSGEPSSSGIGTNFISLDFETHRRLGGVDVRRIPPKRPESVEFSPISNALTTFQVGMGGVQSDR